MKMSQVRNRVEPVNQQSIIWLFTVPVCVLLTAKIWKW